MKIFLKLQITLIIIELMACSISTERDLMNLATDDSLPIQTKLDSSPSAFTEVDQTHGSINEHDGMEPEQSQRDLGGMVISEQDAEVLVNLPHDAEVSAPENDAEVSVVLEDDAELIMMNFPQQMLCDQRVEVSIRVKNLGSATWTREQGYKLGVVDDEDPFYTRDTRVWLAPSIEVAPQQEYIFEFELIAPTQAGVYRTDWRMVREGVHWFGESRVKQIDVVCAQDQPPEDQPNLDTVTWLHNDVSHWPQTGTLSNVTISSDQICMEYDKANIWPIVNLEGVEVVANPWIFIYQNDQWYAGTWEWLRPGQTCKARSSVAGDHIKRAPFGENSGWTPTSGQTYWFMISGLARSSLRNVEERTGLFRVTWP